MSDEHDWRCCVGGCGHTAVTAYWRGSNENGAPEKPRVVFFTTPLSEEQTPWLKSVPRHCHHHALAEFNVAFGNPCFGGVSVSENPAS